MPGVVLRADGKYFDVDMFLQSSSLTPCLIYHAGESSIITKPEKKSQTSGFNVVVSDTDGYKLMEQVNDTIKFFRDNNDELKRLSNFPGVEGVSIDFGIYVRVGEVDSYVRTLRFSSELIKAAGALNISLEITLYPE